MFRNYIKVAWRNLTKHKLFSVINLFGLALSMSVCLIVLLHTKDQLSYDGFHPHPERTYRVITEVTDKQGEEHGLATTPMPLAERLIKEHGFIEKVVRIYPCGTKTAVAQAKELELTAAFVDTGFFQVFGFELQAGDTRSALTAPNTIILNEETATNYFGNVDPIGKTVSVGDYGDFLVTGVLSKAKGKSHIKFDALMSMRSVAGLENSGKLASLSESWYNNTGAYTYFTVQPNTSEGQLDEAVRQIGRPAQQSDGPEKEKISFAVQPLEKIILGRELAYPLGYTGSWDKLLTEIGIGLVLLLSACFNYTNLSLARSLQRGREIGVRKVAGAARLQVFQQFIIESVVVAFLSFGLALLLFKLLVNHLPFIAELSLPDISFDAGLLGWFVGFTVFTGLLAGLLPAWALSSFKPVEVLKNMAGVKLFGSNGLRKTLIVIQFALSLVIVIFAATFFRQFNYLADGDAGYNVKDVINIPLKGADYGRLSQQISHLKGVESISATSANVGRSASGYTAVRREKGAEPVGMEYYDVDASFITTMRLRLVAGTTFKKNTSDAENQIIITETAQKNLQFKTAAEAVGQLVWINDTVPVRVAGVLKDFFYRGLETPYGPMVLRNRLQEFRYLHVRTVAARDTNLMASVEEAWKRIAPYKRFEGGWLYDEIHDRKSAPGTVSVLGFLALVTITLACLGLLGMVVYNTETRRKEIGIRKVMGAGVTAIIVLLSRNYLKLVVVAGLIALPVAYTLTWFFLNFFANRVSIGFGTLALGLGGLLALCLLTIGSQVYKAATANPVKNLRTE